MQDLLMEEAVVRELMLVKVGANPSVRTEIAGIVEPFRASIVDVGYSTMVIQATGERANWIIYLNYFDLMESKK